MIIAPVADLDLVIRDTLREIRRGIATARSANQANPTAGLMADLPEYVDFEIQVITGHQALSRDSSDTDSGTTTNSDNNTDISSNNDTSTESTNQSQSGSSNKTRNASGSLSRSTQNSKSLSGSTSGSRSISKSGSSSGSKSNSRSVSKSGSSSDSRSVSKSGSKSRSSSVSGSGSNSKSTSRSIKSLSKQEADNGRGYGILDEATGEYIGSGNTSNPLGGNDSITMRTAQAVTCGS
jgi:hypothetical protein